MGRRLDWSMTARGDLILVPVLGVDQGIAGVVIPVRDQGHDLDPDIAAVAGLALCPDLVPRDVQYRGQGHGHDRIHVQGPVLQLHADHDPAHVPGQSHHANLFLVHLRNRNQHRLSQSRMETSRSMTSR